jgi:hypothetical protein
LTVAVITAPPSPLTTFDVAGAAAVIDDGHRHATEWLSVRGS